MKHIDPLRLAYIVPSNLIPPFSRPVPQLFLHKPIFSTGRHRTQRNEIYNARSHTQIKNNSLYLHHVPMWDAAVIGSEV